MSPAEVLSIVVDETSKTMECIKCYKDNYLSINNDLRPAAHWILFLKLHGIGDQELRLVVFDAYKIGQTRIK